jgi:hypothetical protein
MRKQFWTLQIFYHKRPRSGHCLELEFDDKPMAIRDAVRWRELGFTCKINTCTDLPLFFHDPRDVVVEELEEVIPPTPVKRGRKPKYQ